MSLHRRAARRDTNEDPIVKALIAAGATVQSISVKGMPDLLVGYNGRDYKFETKHADAKGRTVRVTSGGKRPDARGLTEAQQDWWAAWRGAPPVIVRSPEEALAAIGASHAGPEHLVPRRKTFEAMTLIRRWVPQIGERVIAVGLPGIRGVLRGYLPHSGTVEVEIAAGIANGYTGQWRVDQFEPDRDNITPAGEPGRKGAT